MMPNIYLDYNATTPVDQRVLKAMLPYFSEQFGNASSTAHRFGWDAQEAIDLARRQVAKAIGAKASAIYFTSGATESISLALCGYFEANKHRANHIITCATEHSAVLETCAYLEQNGASVTYLPVNELGHPDLEQLKSSITEQTLLICLMMANNETGTLTDMQAVSAVAKGAGVPLMSDLTQAVGKVPVAVNDLGIDLAVFSAHKIYGPKGVGALYVHPRLTIQPRTFGGKHESGVRPGTQNVPGVVGFGKACELAEQHLDANIHHLQQLRDLLEQALEKRLKLVVNGDLEARLPNVTNVSIAGIDAQRLIGALSTVAVSRGSACASNVARPSHVLEAMGLETSRSLQAIRMSVGLPTTREEVLMAVERIQKAVEYLTLATR